MKDSRDVVIELREKLLDRFNEIHDPRVLGRCHHNLSDILVIAFCSMACGYFSYRDMQWFGVMKQSWFNGFLELPNGIPSHDTFRRIFGLLLPQEVESFLRRWAKAMAPAFKRIVLDGKALKGSEKSFNTLTRPVILLNVYDSERGLVLTQSQAHGTGHGEYEAALESLRLFNIKGALVSTDAGISGKSFTSEVVHLRGDYLVPIKSNQPIVYNILKAASFPRKQMGFVYWETKQTGHGRHETRWCRVLEDDQVYKEVRKNRPEVQTICQVTRIREEKDKRFNLQQKGSDGKVQYRVNPDYGKLRAQREEVFYISSRKLVARHCLESIREHWEIENNLHWVLDVSFGEDACRVRDRRAARTLSALRKIAYNIFQTIPDPTSGLKGPEIGRRSKMKLGALKEGYLEEFLLQLADPKQRQTV